MKLLLKSKYHNICGKVKRIYVPGSMEVHRIPDYGVVALGLHSFNNLVEKSVSKQLPDGMAIKKDGTIFVAGPDGIFVIDKNG